MIHRSTRKSAASISMWTHGCERMRPRDEGKADVLFDESQQVGFRNLIFQAEVVEQRFRVVVLPHHDQQASDDRNQTEHGRMLSSNMLLPNLILLIEVTFSTPTPGYVN